MATNLLGNIYALKNRAKALLEKDFNTTATQFLAI